MSILKSVCQFPFFKKPFGIRNQLAPPNTHFTAHLCTSWQPGAPQSPRGQDSAAATGRKGPLSDQGGLCAGDQAPRQTPQPHLRALRTAAILVAEASRGLSPASVEGEGTCSPGRRCGTDEPIRPWLRTKRTS